MYRPTSRTHGYFYGSPLALFPLKQILLQGYTLRENCPYSGLFWSVFSRIRTEYREIGSISVRVQENKDQNNSEYGHFLHTGQTSFIITQASRKTSFSLIHRSLHYSKHVQSKRYTKLPDSIFLFEL